MESEKLQIYPLLLLGNAECNACITYLTRSGLNSHVDRNVKVLANRMLWKMMLETFFQVKVLLHP